MNPLWFKPQTWRALWIALRRAPKDSHARTILLRLLLSLLVFAAWIVWNFYQFRGLSLEFGRVGDVIILMVLTAIVLVFAGGALSYKMERRATELNSPSVAPDLKMALFREAYLLATLLERLASEYGMEKELPPTIEVITRRVLLDRLTRLGIREGLEPWLLDLLLAPDGHWTPEQKQRAASAWEYFAVLRWVLGLGELRSLTQVPNYKIEDLRSLIATKQPKKLMVLASWDLRPARNEANVFFNRSWTELMARGELSNTAQDDVERAIELRAEIVGEGYTGDYLIGAQTITELATPLLWMVTLRAFHRWELLTLLVDVTSGDEKPKRLRDSFAKFFAADAPPPGDPA